MPRYRVLIHGRNFLLNFDGRWKRAGFYTPRYADAPNESMAEHVATEDFRHSAQYRGLLKSCLNADNFDDSPTLRGEDIEETTSDADFEYGLPGLAVYTDPAEKAGPADSENGC